MPFKNKLNLLATDLVVIVMHDDPYSVSVCVVGGAGWCMCCDCEGLMCVFEGVPVYPGLWALGELGEGQLAQVQVPLWPQGPTLQQLLPGEKRGGQCSSE